MELDSKKIVCCCVFVFLILPGYAFSLEKKPIRTNTNWIAELQRCRSAQDTLERICARIPDGEGNTSLYSLVLIRLSRQLVTAQSQRFAVAESELAQRAAGAIQRMVVGLTRVHDCNQATVVNEVVEGTKAVAVLARHFGLKYPLYSPLGDFWQQFLAIDGKTELLTASAMTGLKWAMDTLRSIDESNAEHARKHVLPESFLRAYEDLQVPFKIIPNCLKLNGTIDDTATIQTLIEEVDFRADIIETSSTRLTVKERRWTSWQGDKGVAPFVYSGKAMPRRDWTPSILLIRNQLHHETQQYYNGCLLNYYPNGQSAMRYHRDPDQGILWDFDTAVVSIGSPRAFSFRNNKKEIHNFVVFHGDVTHMFDDCQARFEHTVKKADQAESPRISLVFKRSL